MNFTINEIKKHLGPGLGLRKNRYMIEVPVPVVSGETINVLCQSAGLPERNNVTSDLWHKGRKYTVRGETDFIGEYTISIIDDDEMRIRKLFDSWMKTMDNTRPDKNASLLGASFEEISPVSLNEIEQGLGLVNTIKNTVQNQRQLADFAIGQFAANSGLPSARYQTDINIWQLANLNSGISEDSKKVYGYKLQNAFPKQIGIVSLEDGEENTLSQFSVTFAFSEYIPLYGIKQDITNAVLGDQVSDILNATQALI